MKRVIITIIGIFWAMSSIAQQDAQYSFYMFNNLYFNPAYTGKKEALHVEMLHREQWRFFNIGEGIDGAPQSTSISIHSPFKRSNNALGFNFNNDIIGPFKTFDFNVSYAYRIPIGSKLKLSFGVQGTYKLYQVDNIRFLNPNDPTAHEFNDFPNVNTFNFGAGAYLWNKKDRFYVGFSVPHLLNNKLYHNLAAGSTSNNAQEHQHYFLTSGLVVGKEGGMFKFYPSFMAKFVKNAPIDLDLNANFLLYERLWLGAGYRFGGNYYDTEKLKLGKGSAVIGMVKFMVVKNLEIGYAYDYTLSDLGSYQKGSHEFLVNFKFDRKNQGVEGMRITTPRYINYF